MRPRIDIDLDRVAELAGRGLTQAEICLVLGISEATLYNRKRESEVFTDAIKRGRAVAAEAVANKLYDMAVAGDLGAIVWWEKTRCGRTDKVAHEVTGKDGGPVEITALTQAQADQRLAEWRQQQISKLPSGLAAQPMPDTSLTTTG